MGGSWRTQREPLQAQGEHENSTTETPWPENWNQNVPGCLLINFSILIVHLRIILFNKNMFWMILDLFVNYTVNTAQSTENWMVCSSVVDCGRYSQDISENRITAWLDIVSVKLEVFCPHVFNIDAFQWQTEWPLTGKSWFMAQWWRLGVQG